MNWKAKPCGLYKHTSYLYRSVYSRDFLEDTMYLTVQHLVMMGNFLALFPIPAFNVRVRNSLRWNLTRKKLQIIINYFGDILLFDIWVKKMCIPYHLGAMCCVSINVVVPAPGLLKDEAHLGVAYIHWAYRSILLPNQFNSTGSNLCEHKCTDRH